MKRRTTFLIGILAFADLSTSTEVKLDDNILTSPKLEKIIIPSESRSLEQGFEYDTSWLANYSLQFQGCHGIIQYGEGGGRRQGANGEDGTLYMQNLVKFRVCPINSCDKGCKGSYLVDLNEFVESYVEYKQEATEMACENLRENCYCSDDSMDDEDCQNKCFEDAGMNDCIETDDEEEEFEIQRFLRCEELENYNDDSSKTYYVGPRCANKGKSIFLDVFEDAGCIQPAPSGTYEQLNYYGASLLYTKKSIVEMDCLPCNQIKNGNENENDDGEIEINEICENVYEEAAKCEKGLSIDNPRNAECNFIESEVLTHDVRYKNPKTVIISSWVLLCTTLALGHKVMTLQNEIERSNVKLTEHDGGVIA